MGLLGWAWNGIVYGLLFLCLGMAVQQFVGNYGRERGYFEQQNQNRSTIGSSNYPLIVLYHGRPPGAQYEWNSGVWPAWGKDRHDLYHRRVHQSLEWQAAGIQITKTCDVHCIVTHDQSFLPRADAVVMELVNHYKFYGQNTDIPLAWPKKENQQKWGLFYYEAPSEFPMISQNAEVLSKFDFLVTPQKEAAVPVTLMCDWGYPRAQFVTIPPPQEAREIFLADFRGVTPPGYEDFFQELRSLLKIDIFAGPHQNTPLPDEPYTLPQRILHMGKYRFVFILESILEDNWICPELSQALLSGAVPIYLGAPNVGEFLPHARAIVNVRDYTSPSELAEFLLSCGHDLEPWQSEFHVWKQEGLSPAFANTLDQCVHYAECRICKQVLQLHHPSS